jgi:hypothetical protein
LTGIIVPVRIGDVKSLALKTVFDWWDDDSSLAADVSQNRETVKKWRQRSRVPDEHWPALILAAKAKGKDLSADMLLAMHERARRSAA